MKSLVAVISFAALLGFATGQQNKPTTKGTCGGRFRGSHGRIASPGFPSALYANKEKCVYEIEVEPGMKVAYRSMYMNLEQPVVGNCYDTVSIYRSGNVADVPDNHCGDIKIPDEMSEGNKLIVMFKTDSSVVSDGFVIAWAAVNPKEMKETFDCDFDGPTGLCPGWKQSDQDMFDWTIKRGRTRGSYTGPYSDHSTGSHLGRYAYIEAFNQRINDAAILISPSISLSSVPEFCLTFWYQNYGTSSAVLYVVRVSTRDGKGEFIFADVQKRGAGWKEVRRTLYGSDDPMQIAFEARRGQTYYSALAIDDIKLRRGACKPMNVMAPRTTTMPTTTTTTTTTTTSPTTTTLSACESNKVFRACALPCDRTCDRDNCKTGCVPRCVCPYYAPVWHENRCISLSRCPVTTTTQPPATTSGRQRERTLSNEAFSMYMQLLQLYQAWTKSQPQA